MIVCIRCIDFSVDADFWFDTTRCMMYINFKVIRLIVCIDFSVSTPLSPPSVSPSPIVSPSLSLYLTPQTYTLSLHIYLSLSPPPFSTPSLSLTLLSPYLYLFLSPYLFLSLLPSLPPSIYISISHPKHTHPLPV